MKNPFQAKSPLMGKVSRTLFRAGIYPTIPAGWPNRSIRRAVKFGRTLPTEWTMHFMNFPHLKEFIKTGQMA